MTTKTKGGWNGLSVQVANKLFQNTGVIFEDRKQTEGSYVAIHPDGIRTIRKSKSTEVTQSVIDSWFTLKQ